MKTSVAIMEAQKKGKTRNIARVEAPRKNESQLKFAIVNM
jgi:hypothetical protein